MSQSATTKASVSSQSHSEIISTQVQGGGNVSMNFTFIMADNTKIAMNTRRKFEAQVCIGIIMLYNWDRLDFAKCADSS